MSGVDRENGPGSPPSIADDPRRHESVRDEPIEPAGPPARPCPAGGQPPDRGSRRGRRRPGARIADTGRQRKSPISERDWARPFRQGRRCLIERRIARLHDELRPGQPRMVDDERLGMLISMPTSWGGRFPRCTTRSSKRNGVRRGAARQPTVGRVADAPRWRDSTASMSPCSMPQTRLRMPRRYPKKYPLLTHPLL